MHAAWVVSANAGRARVFSEVGDSEFAEVQNMVNTGARALAAELETDELGQRAASKSRHGTGAPRQPSGYQPNQTPTQHQTELFARDLADFLKEAREQGRYETLCVAASPEFLGVLRKVLDPGVKSAVVEEIDKDLTQLSPRELHERLHPGMGPH